MTSFQSVRMRVLEPMPTVTHLFQPGQTYINKATSANSIALGPSIFKLQHIVMQIDKEKKELSRGRASTMNKMNRKLVHKTGSKKNNFNNVGFFTKF